MSVTYNLQQLAEHVQGKVVGDDSTEVNSVATLSGAGPGSISFLTNSVYKKQLESTKASAVILREENLEDCKVNAIVVNNPHVAYAKIATLLYPQYKNESQVHPSAIIADNVNLDSSVTVAANVVIEEGVQIHEDCYIGPGCVIGRNSVIGKNSILLANVTICNECIIGEKALIHPGVVIGSDGFGQANDNGTWLKIPQIGRVVIGDDVEIGANTTIDRGAIEDTVIGDNVKLDNQIQIAHNVKIGSHTVMSGCTAVAGSTHIGKHCAIGGAVGIVGHLEIVDNVQITAMSLVTGSIKSPGVYSSGTPLELNQKWHKNAVRFKQLDDIARRLRLLEKRQKS